MEIEELQVMVERLKKNSSKLDLFQDKQAPHPLKFAQV
jgi:hypothetical protein